MKTQTKPTGIIVAGVGGQGAVTLAQLILGAALKAGYNVMQSEVHGMSQRGGSVNAHVVFDKNPVTSPVVTDGQADLLIAIEPLEALRYVQFLSKEAALIVSKSPIKNMSTYPDEASIFSALERLPHTQLVDTEAHSKTLANPQAANTLLLGMASKHLPISDAIWKETIRERFISKGELVVEKNIKAFEYGKTL